MKITTERLYLRPATIKDVAHVRALCQSEPFIEYIGRRAVDTDEEAKKYIQEKMVDHYLQHGYGNYLVFNKLTGEFIGSASLFNRPEVEGVDIGYAVLPEHFRKGYAYEAAQALMEYARDTLKMQFLTAYTSYKNEASQKLLEKLGLHFVKEVSWGEWKEVFPMYRIDF